MSEELHDINIEPADAVLVWAVEYSAQLLSRSQRSAADGRTAYERRKGKPYRRKLPVFSEKIMFL